MSIQLQIFLIQCLHKQMKIGISYVHSFLCLLSVSFLCFQKMAESFNLQASWPLFIWQVLVILYSFIIAHGQIKDAADLQQSPQPNLEQSFTGIVCIYLVALTVFLEAKLNSNCEYCGHWRRTDRNRRWDPWKISY